ncbi:uncharacterized protein LOC119369061 [Jatropha curcas]|uniref:uncharacterized protein LOC119369061 n=1 Tax=Jatropha curcas TaxID=180498 RepID=UPI0018952C88|nr:uncharacterized protein LOC119369061 [Jatropha curcas]
MAEVAVGDAAFSVKMIKLSLSSVDPSEYIKAIISMLAMIRQGESIEDDRITSFTEKFLDDFSISERYETLIQSGILETFVALYKCENITTHREKGKEYILYLLNLIASTHLTSCLDERASVVLELCLFLSSKGEDPLYLLTIRRLRELAEKRKDVLRFKLKMETISQISFVVEDLQDRLIRDLDLCNTSSSSKENAGSFLDDFKDFKMEHLLEALQIDYIGKENVRPEWSLYLAILEELNFISKIFEDANEEFWDVLKKTKVSIRALILRCAGRTDGYEYGWLLKHNDVTNSESRMHLALLMIPQVKEPDVKTIKKVFDWSQNNLPANLLGVFVNEELTDPQFLKDWLCKSSRAIFNSENPLFLARPDDATRFYLNHELIPQFFHRECVKFAGEVIALALIYKVRVGVTLDPELLSPFKVSSLDSKSLVSCFSSGFLNVFGVSIEELRRVGGLEIEDINKELHGPWRSNHSADSTKI